MLKHYVKFLYPAILFPESIEREIKSRNYKKLNRIPKDCFGFRFFDREEVKKNGEILKGRIKNWSGMYYFGKIYTIDQLKKEFPKERILIGNVERNSRTGKAIRTRCGNWQIFEKGDKLIGE